MQTVLVQAEDFFLVDKGQPAYCERSTCMIIRWATSVEDDGLLLPSELRELVPPPLPFLTDDADDLVGPL